MMREMTVNIIIN